jgi:hypothetical protein
MHIAAVSCNPNKLDLHDTLRALRQMLQETGVTQ